MRRVGWFVAGLVAGCAAAIWTIAGVRRTRGRMSIGLGTSRLGEAVAQGRETMRVYEATHAIADEPRSARR